MALSAGDRLGPYEILAPLGAGGMGEVYRAADTKLGREVAIKVLPTEVAQDPERLARFQREATLLASLNHPHIAAIYGLEEEAGNPFLVLELVEGEDLAERLKRGPVPVGEALEIARQVAEALEEAHEKGIIHRDLKPANVKIREDGTVKVLDFGLAKAMDPMATQSPVESHSPTKPSPAMSGAGVILGTAAYMAPEQARGRAVDKRTDIWAFGALLYEMLTGTRAFDGEDTTELIAAVVKTTPNWTALPAEVPPHVLTLIQRCLEKDRKERIGDIAVARFLLAGHANLAASAAAATATPRAAPAWRQALPWALAAVLAGAVMGWLGSRRPGGALPVTHLLMSVHPADQLVGSNLSVRPSRTALAISPDGRRVVFSAMQGTVTQLYVRGLDEAAATPIPGTEGAIGPFFSPDGEWIGFWADNKLKKVPTAGGPPATISDAQGVDDAGLLGASWGDDGTIVFANAAGLFRVASVGGPATPIATPDASAGERILLPHQLPGGKALLFTAMTGGYGETANVVLQSLDTSERRVLIQGGADARYVRTGHLVYMKTGTLMAVPFDVGSRQVTGAPVALIEEVMQGVNAPFGSDETGAGQFAVSDSGTLLYVDGGIGPVQESSLMWVDRRGAARPVAAVPPGAYLSYRLSPNEEKFAVFMPRGASRRCDVWVYDLRRGAPTRLTFADGNVNPIWSPDGKRLVYASDANVAGVYDLFAVNADGSDTPERLTTRRRRELSLLVGAEHQRDRLRALRRSPRRSSPMISGFFHWRATASRGCSWNPLLA